MVLCVEGVRRGRRGRGANNSEQGPHVLEIQRACTSQEKIIPNGCNQEVPTDVMALAGRCGGASS